MCYYNKWQIGDHVKAWNHITRQHISGDIVQIDKIKPSDGITIKLDDDAGEIFIPMESTNLWIFEEIGLGEWM